MIFDDLITFDYIACFLPQATTIREESTVNMKSDVGPRHNVKNCAVLHMRIKYIGQASN